MSFLLTNVCGPGIEAEFVRLLKGLFPSDLLLLADNLADVNNEHGRIGTADGE